MFNDDRYLQICMIIKGLLELKCFLMRDHLQFVLGDSYKTYLTRFHNLVFYEISLNNIDPKNCCSKSGTSY